MTPEATPGTTASVLLGEPGPEPAAACRFDQIRAPVTIVIFGATGDLTARMLLPALLALISGGHLPERFAVVGTGRTALTDDAFRQRLAKAASGEAATPPPAFDLLAPRLRYRQLDYDDPASFAALAAFLETLSREAGLGANRIFYLAVPPTAYESIAIGLARAGLAEETAGHARLVIEKPFGRDLETARVLETALHTRFAERQIFRIDHYLAKETVQNILTLRFANTIFEPLWNRRYVESVRIVAAESIGLEHRAAYYDHFGVLRDMFQNHMLQLLALCAMEPPPRFEAELVRDEKTKVFRSLRPQTPADVTANLVLGQYGPGRAGDREVPGYRQEPGVPADSRTPTFAALRLFVDNWRWQGVPFFLVSGKRLPEKRTEIAVRFKAVPHALFREVIGGAIAANTLILRIQPDERVLLTFQAKAPGPMCLRPVTMDFRYFGDDAGPVLPAYARVLLDCLQGDQMLFWRQDGVEECWRFLAPMLAAEPAGGPTPYPAGTWGPAAAEILLGGRGGAP